MLMKAKRAAPAAATTYSRAAGTARRSEIIIVFAIFALVTVALWFSAPHDGEFWWSDSPRHALNGVFLNDMLAAFPWHAPARYAMQYYVQYPALTILFYPPLFYVLSIPFYALFGVSHGTALAVVLLHYLALAFGLFLLARRWLAWPVALAVGLAALLAPGIALWGRQVMLEIPALAFAVWALLLLRRHAETAKPALLYLGLFLLLCAIYTKITLVFLAPVAALMLWVAEGSAVLRQRHNWIAALAFLIGLIPVAVLTLKFGAANVQSVVGIADAEVSRRSLAGWLWYARQLPDQLGWALLFAALLAPLLALAGRRPQGFGRTDLALLGGWFVIGYIFFSLIDLKEARHSTAILPPLLIAAGLALQQLRFAAAPLALLLALGTGLYTWRYAPVPQVAGYRQAALWMVHNAPKGSVILFSGKRDGSFIFNLRSLDPHRDYYVVRSDKLLLEVAVRRELGVTEKSLSEAQIGDLLDRDGIRYVVAQSDFWTDLDEMARLQDVLRSDHFVEVARIPVIANVPVEDRELRIYRNQHKVTPTANPLVLDLPIIGRSVEGETGGSH